MMINKTNKSMLNSITSVLYTIISGLCNLVVIRKLIQVYGSDFNGINSTASQFISVLMIIEGGFALAANVALFKPLSDNNHEKINGILSAVNKKFHRIGFIFVVAGAITSIIFAFVVKSELDLYIRFGVFAFLVLSTGFSLYYSTKYKILFQSDQREYILHIISIITIVLTNILMYIAILFELHPLVLRVIVMLFAIINSLSIGILCKKQYSYIDISVVPDNKSIVGTSDVFMQKIVGVVYFAAPIVSISVFVSTAAASVYAVYNTVITLLRSVENSILNAPRMSFGRLIAEHGIESSKVRKVFDEYEYSAITSISILLSTAAVMIMPFIRLYAENFYDASYIDWMLAVLMIVTCFIESVHIPSGNLINMSGHFKAGKIIQAIAGIILLAGLIVGGILYQIRGILIAVLFAAIALAAMEMGYARCKLLRGGFASLLRTFFINVVISFIAII